MKYIMELDHNINLNSLCTVFKFSQEHSVSAKLPIRLANLTLKKLHGLSPLANYTDRATAACQRSNCKLLRIEGATWSA
jgi:hypothetical protein